MSLIEKALELEKQQRRAAADARDARDVRSGDAQMPGGSPAEATAADATPATQPGIPPRIDLTSVRTVSTDSRLLDVNRVLSETNTRQPAENAYRMLRTRVMRQMRSNGWLSLGITAAGVNEGKTLTAINLAVSVAAERIQPVVLVDLDLRRPRIHTYLGIGENQFPDVADYLEGRVPALEDLLISPGIQGLSCMLNSRVIDRSSDLLASPRGQAFLTELRQRLPGVLVIIDLPPLLATDDPLVVAPMIDGLLLVVAEGGSTRSDVASAAKLLAEFNLVGSVLNKSVERSGQDYYTY